MRRHHAWRSALPVLLLAAACGETSSPTDVAARGARFEIAAMTSASECETRITTLLARTEDPTRTPIVGKNAVKDRAGLVGKLNEALTALDKGKNADAVQKLSDYIAKVDQLAAAGKLDAAIAGELKTDAQATIDCIDMIGA